MVLRNPQTRPSLGGLDQTRTKSDQTIPITGENPPTHVNGINHTRVVDVFDLL
jgi:hypothetical protein